MFIMSNDGTGKVGAGFANIQDITPLCKCCPGFRVIFLNNLSSLRAVRKSRFLLQARALDRSGLDRKRKWKRRENWKNIFTLIVKKSSHGGDVIHSTKLFSKNRYRKVSDNFQHFSNLAVGVIQMLSSTASHWILGGTNEDKAAPAVNTVSTSTTK